ncbi:MULTISPECIES: sulfatase-like hydrolase/transferase [unclassified Sphingobium]|uniref:sulfatase-like hydrolase/transferase n=1 Tax=unclassified Sphingobium TaxID=2611147 RepID=UPI002225658D|nr:MULTISPECIES: sulfatase-like hydrolase/transferase [unclassified Sphingobium]MCW2380639.1 arylsulfatase A-like enzyme [Sphingobium sp. B2D3B]MCW2399253.1 arylsulfatase A-like enzyme [Sphingobium sp. B2D3C]
MAISRRDMLGGLTAASVATGCTTTAQTSRPGPRGRPNILWLVSEDNNPFIGAYGDSIAHTPHIDALAHRGLLYRKIYANAPVCAPARFCLLTGIYPESNAPANHMRADASLPDFLKTYPQLLRTAGYYCTNNEKTDYNAAVNPASIWDESSAKAHYRNRPANTPFMAVFNFNTTHESQLFGITEGKVKPEQVRVPPYLPDSPAVRQDFASYYNLMERMDAQVGEKLAELEDAGLADDTIIFYFSDNGGCMPRSKRHCHEEGLRCALVVHVPDKWADYAPAAMGGEIAAPVSFIDFVPTLLSIAGIPQPATMPGTAFLGRKIARPKAYAFGMRNRMDERYDFVRTVADGHYRYIRNYMPHRPMGQVNAFPMMLRSYQDWYRRYAAGELNAVQSRFFEPRPYEELYDLEADPDQLQNLAADPKQSRRLSALRTALDQHMLDINDNGFIPEGSPLEGYEASRQPHAYPLADIMALAAQAATGGPSALPDLTRALTHDNEVMRYWAATGLLIRKAQAAPARETLLSASKRETSAQVRVVMAEALTHLSEGEQAKQIFAELLAANPPEMVALQTLNALTYIEPVYRPMDMLARWKTDPGYVGRATRYLTRVSEGTYDPSVSLLPPRGV